MAEFLLIHGSNHGAWCWRDVMVALEQAGHGVRAIDLPGAGLDGTPPAEVTIDDYRAAILEALTRPAVLVGHSLGGIAITEAAAAAPDKIAALVYLCAWAPAPGQTARDLRRKYGCETLLRAITMSADHVTSSFADDMLEEVFYHDCPPGTVEYARAHLTPQPVAISTAPAPPLPATLPRHYIRCLHDRAIPAEAQTDMSKDWPENTVHDMHCGHSPFFAQPQELSQLLIDIAEAS